MKHKIYRSTEITQTNHKFLNNQSELMSHISNFFYLVSRRKPYMYEQFHVPYVGCKTITKKTYFNLKKFKHVSETDDVSYDYFRLNNSLRYFS